MAVNLERIGERVFLVVADESPEMPTRCAMPAAAPSAPAAGSPCFMSWRRRRASNGAPSST
jgi:hypothetical protein